MSRCHGRRLTESQPLAIRLCLGSFSPCQWLLTIYLLGHYEREGNLSDLGILALICTWGGLRAQSDYPEFNQARAYPPESAPVWTYNREGPLRWASPPTLHTQCLGNSCSASLSPFPFSPGAWGSEPRSRNVCPGAHWISERVSRHVLNSLSSLSPQSLLFLFPAVKFIYFSITWSVKEAEFDPRLWNRKVY